MCSEYPKHLLNVPEELVREPPEQACPGSDGALQLAYSASQCQSCPSLPCSVFTQVVWSQPYWRFQNDIPFLSLTQSKISLDVGNFLLKTLQLGILWTDVSALGVSEAVQWLNAPTLRGSSPSSAVWYFPSFQKSSFTSTALAASRKASHSHGIMKIEWCPPANWVLEKKGL